MSPPGSGAPLMGSSLSSTKAQLYRRWDSPGPSPQSQPKAKLSEELMGSV